MAKKIQITEKQAHQFNRMLLQLRRIRQYQTPDQLRRSSERTIGLEFEEALEMAYENMQGEVDVKGIKPIHIDNRPDSVGTALPGHASAILEK